MDGPPEAPPRSAAGSARGKKKGAACLVQTERPSASPSLFRSLTEEPLDLSITKNNQRAWATATKPAQNMMMMGFMLWMSGQSLHIFSMMTVGTALWQPLSAIWKANDTFSPLADDRNNVMLPKLAYCAINLGGLLLGLWKLNSLGLMPTHASDWVSGLPPPLSSESATSGVAL